MFGQAGCQVPFSIKPSTFLGMAQDNLHHSVFGPFHKKQTYFFTFAAYLPLAYCLSHCKALQSWMNYQLPPDCFSLFQIQKDYLKLFCIEQGWFSSFLDSASEDLTGDLISLVFDILARCFTMHASILSKVKTKC
jgi:hypothetical protein